MAAAPTWQQQAKAKKDAVIGLLPEAYNRDFSELKDRDVTGSTLWSYLSPRDVEITETNAEDIVKQTTTGQWTAEEVATAFINRASLAHKLVNCLHEVFFDDAIAEAKKLDAYFAEHKKPVGPLHGLPVSLKDQFHVRGVETTMGYVGWIGTFQGQKGTGKEKVFESEMVRELRNLGAVLYCKTSVPHTLMTGETVNHIIGYTWNPKNRNLSSGGSSGGEGALIAMKGSPLGFGTDIGGSIRIPAGFNGQYGLRPSTGRMPYEGMANSMDGQNTVLSVVGPLSSSLGGLRLAMTAILSQQPWLHDPLVHELPWRSEQEKQVEDIVAGSESKLVFAVLGNDGTVTPYPPVRRAIDTAIKAVEAAGHKVIEWKPPSHERGNNIGLKSWLYDGGEDVHSALGLSGEPLVNQVNVLYGEKRPQFDATAIAATNVEKREYQKEYMEYWNSTAELTGTQRPVDAIIMPLAPFPAARPEKYKYYGYSSIINLLDYPSCVIPATTVDKAIDSVDTNFSSLNDFDQDSYGDYDPEIYDGAHVAVQIVGRRLNEEKTLAIASEVDKAIKGLK